MVLGVAIWYAGFRHFLRRLTQVVQRALLDNAGIAGDMVRYVLQQDHPPRVYCVQYQETELAFIQRLMAEEGIFYYVEHYEKQHVLVIADGQATHQPVIGLVDIPYRHNANMVPEHSVIYDFRYASLLAP